MIGWNIVIGGKTFKPWQEIDKHCKPDFYTEEGDKEEFPFLEFRDFQADYILDPVAECSDFIEFHQDYFTRLSKATQVDFFTINFFGKFNSYRSIDIPTETMKKFSNLNINVSFETIHTKEIAQMIEKNARPDN